MKKTFAILFLISTILLSCKHKDNNADLFLKDIKNYSEAYNKKDWGKVTSIIYPKLFDFMSKQEMINLLNLVDSMGLNIHLNYDKIDSVSEVAVSGNEQFCVFYYSGILKLIITNDLLLSSLDPLQAQNEQAYGKGNVKWDEKEKTFTINAHQAMIAVAGKDSANWKYIEYKKENQDLMPKLLPEEVRSRLKL